MHCLCKLQCICSWLFSCDSRVRWAFLYTGRCGIRVTLLIVTLQHRLEAYHFLKSGLMSWKKLCGLFQLILTHQAKWRPTSHMSRDFLHMYICHSCAVPDWKWSFKLVFHLNATGKHPLSSIYLLPTSTYLEFPFSEWFLGFKKSWFSAV